MLALLASLLQPTPAPAAAAIEVLGKDFAFPHPQPGLPARLSDFDALEINSFRTRDGVKLSYWEAGSGRPLIFIPGWSGNGAQYINVMYLLSHQYHVYVLDPRNQGLSERVSHGMRITRLSADLKEFMEHLEIESADCVGWSMGAAVLWGYLDLFGQQRLRKVVFVDEPPSIYAHTDWSEQERLEAGGMTSSVEHLVASFITGAPSHQLMVDTSVLERAQAKDSPYYVNSESFAQAFIQPDLARTRQTLFDHVTNDWRDVILHKINLPTAIFSGEYSHNLPSQRWMGTAIPRAQLHVYSRAEQGDHFLMFKNPFKFTRDLSTFLDP
jgi:pimeloyl-ACP methyl ester carboxylesterase